MTAYPGSAFPRARSLLALLAASSLFSAPVFAQESFDEVKGTIARRDLQANKLLTLSDLGQPALIHRMTTTAVLPSPIRRARLPSGSV